MSAEPALTSEHQLPDLPQERGYLSWVYERVAAMIKDSLYNIEHGAGADTATNSILAKIYKEKIRNLEGAQDEILIGRLDLLNRETYYVGKIHVDGEGIERPAVIDWRANLAEKFYQAGRNDAMGVGRRRTFQMRRRSIHRYSDETLVQGFRVRRPGLTVVVPPAVAERPRLAPAAPTAAPEVAPVPQLAQPDGQPVAVPAASEVDLRAVDMVLDELSRTRDRQMREVVATIQAEQDRVIRSDIHRPLVVQGGPGTGKTIVGLHRAAYVLYQQRQTLQRETAVLVVGPNRQFVDYIRSVLPALGEYDAVQVAIDELALMDLPKRERDRIRVTAVDDPAVARVKGSARMSDVVRRAVWSQAWDPEVSFRYRSRKVAVPEDVVSALIAQLKRSALSYTEARQVLARRLVDELRRVYIESRGSQAVVDVADFNQSATVALRDGGIVDQLLPPVTAVGVVRRLLSEETFLEAAAGASLTPNQKAAMLRASTRWSWSAADLPLIAEAHALITGRPERVGHIVIDEGQDLSAMQWRMIRQRLAGGGITVLGDIAQATAPGALSSWAPLQSHLGLDELEVMTLEVGYRVPQQIMDLVAPLVREIDPSLVIPFSIRSTEEPDLQKVTAASLWDAALTRAASYADGSVAVIVPDGQEKTALAALAPIGRTTPTLDLSVLTATEAKGLEFDHVIVIEPAQIADGTNTGKRLLLIALTRATKTLTVLHSQPLPKAIRPEGEPEEEPAPAPRLGTAESRRFRRLLLREQPSGNCRVVTRFRGETVIRQEQDGWLFLETPTGERGWAPATEVRVSW